MDDNTFISKVNEKRRDVLIKFRSMEEILNNNAAWFDYHGNLKVHDHYGCRVDHLSPAYFHYLGKTVKQLSHHSFPDWAIEREWDDLFAPNMALRAIASGNMSPEDMVELAKRSVLIPSPVETIAKESETA